MQSCEVGDWVKLAWSMPGTQLLSSNGCFIISLPSSLASINNRHPAVWRTGATPLGSQPSVASQTEPLLALQISPSQISNSQEPQRRAPDCSHKPSLRRMFEEQSKTLCLSNFRVFTIQLWPHSSLLYSSYRLFNYPVDPFPKKIQRPHSHQREIKKHSPQLSLDHAPHRLTCRNKNPPCTAHCNNRFRLIFT